MLSSSSSSVAPWLNTRDLWQPANEPLAIFPVLKLKPERHVWWRRRESNPRPRKPALKSLRA